MNRRHFIKTLLASTATMGVSSLSQRQAYAAITNDFPALNQPILVFIYLPGGPDFRHLLPAPYQAEVTSYGYQHWQARATAHALDPETPASWAQRWVNDYTEYSHNTTSFGILNKAGWLQSMWNTGNVAIINNVVGGTSRNHPHCQRILDQGNVDAGPNDVDLPGWGGRFAQAAGGHVISLTSTPRQFCFGSDPSNPLKPSAAPLISMPDSRNMAIYESTTENARSATGEISRSLKAYYAAKKNELEADSVYRQFVEHETRIRGIGGQINTLLASEPIPAEIEALYSGDNTLNSTYFGKQIRNLRDSLALTDLLNMKAVSLEYASWDSHKQQKDFIEPKLEDIFGSGGGLDTLYQSLPSSIADQLVFVVAGEFGRQLKANGRGGTDHGRGNTMLIIGNTVNGTGESTVHGDMYPLTELDRLGDRSPDIHGLTAIDHVLGAVCDGIQPGSGHVVFPNRTSRPIEDGVDLSGLLT